MESLPAKHIRSTTRVLMHIENHLASNLGLGVLARVGHYSPYHLHSVFKVVTGTSPGDYVQRRRLALAANLLANQPPSIGELATICGYRDTAAFSRAFRRRYGAPPLQFRRDPERYRADDPAPTPPHSPFASIPEEPVGWTEELPELFVVGKQSKTRCLLTENGFDDLTERLRREEYTTDFPVWISLVHGMAEDGSFAPRNYDCCVVVNPELHITGPGLDARWLPGGRYAGVMVSSAGDALEEGFQWLKHTYLPGRNLRRKMGPLLEIHLTLPDEARHRHIYSGLLVPVEGS